MERLVTKIRETGLSNPSEALLYKPAAANNMYLTAVATMTESVMLSVEHPPGSQCMRCSVHCEQS